MIWYKMGRPTATEFMKYLPKDLDTGDVAKYNSLLAWRNKYAWDMRADVLDAEVTRQIEIQAINEKVEMLRRQADLGKRLQDAGEDYFLHNAIVSDRVALGAIKTGVEIERNARGIPDALLKIADLKDEELGDIVGKLLSKINPDEALQLTGSVVDSIDAEFSESKETVDADSETTEQTE